MESEKMLAFLKEYYGKPDYHFEYTVSKRNIKVNLLVYLPIPEEGIFTSSLMTAGFSSLEFQLKEHKVECLFELKGTLTENAYNILGKKLIEQFNKCIPIVPNGIHVPINLSSHEHLTGCLLLNYGKHEPYLWESNPVVRAFEFIPLYQEEIDSLVKQPIEISNVVIFRSTNVDWANWDRPKARIIQEAVSGVWSYISKWYKEHTPKLFNQLKVGASQNSIAKLNDILGVTLPEDFVASLMIYNGEVDFHDYQYLSSENIEKTWKMMNEILKSKAFPSQLPDNKKIEQMQDVWWHEGWIPFAKDSAGNLMCMDLAPSSSGSKGQIIYWEKVEGPLLTQYKTFFHWLYAYEQALYGGYYKIDDEGFVY